MEWSLGEHASYPRGEEKLLPDVAERGPHTARAQGPTDSVSSAHGTHGTLCPTHPGASLLTQPLTLSCQTGNKEDIPSLKYDV